ncbi:MAG: signal peptidase II [Clostridia bacterium]|nr:signal peptidase II [Clostridia bacterium]
MFKKKLKPQFGKLSIILLGVIAVLIAADLLTKYLEEQFVWNAVIIPSFIVIKSGVHNPGCAFSFLDENPEIGQPILITLTFLLLAVLIFAFIFMPNRHVVLKVAISLLIGGAVGNLVDRLAFSYVRDWFGLWMFGSIAFCNLADFWIVIGAILAVLDLMFLNDWAVFPLTKRAKAAQQARKEEEEKERAKSNNVSADIENNVQVDVNIEITNENVQVITNTDDQENNNE